MTAGVYFIFNKKTGQLYLGGSMNIEDRIRKHISNPNKCSYIDNAIQKYGWDKFGWVILEETDPDWKIIGAREKYWIAYYNAFEDPYHYNLTEGGEGKSGYRKPYENFKYTVSKHGFNNDGQQRYGIHNRDHKTIKSSINKDFLNELAEKLNNGFLTEEEVTSKTFKYTVQKAGFHRGKQYYRISDNDNNPIKSSINKEILYELVEKLNNDLLTEEEVKFINLNPFKYTVVKCGFTENGKQNYRISGKNGDQIKVSIDKDFLNELVEKLNNGSLTEEELKSKTFKYTITKAGFDNGKQRYGIRDTHHNFIKVSIDKKALNKIADALNSGSLTEEVVKNNRGVDLL